MAREIISISSVASPELQIMTIESYWYETTMLSHSGRQQTIVRLSLNDLNLPMHPFNMMTAPFTETRSPFLAIMTSRYKSNHLIIPTYLHQQEWLLQWTLARHETLSDVFYSDESRRISVKSSPTFTAPASPPRKQKKKLRVWMSFWKQEECCRTPAKPAVNHYQQEIYPKTQKKLRLSI